MKLFFLSFFIYLMVSTLQAQDTLVTVPLYKGTKTSKLISYITDVFNSEECKNLTKGLCISGVTFVKFDVSADGLLEHIVFNISSNPILNQIFTNILDSTNGQWTPSMYKDKPIRSKPIILSLVYDIKASHPCNVSVPWNAKFRDAVYNLSHFIPYDGIDCIFFPAIPLSPIE